MPRSYAPIGPRPTDPRDTRTNHTRQTRNPRGRFATQYDRIKIDRWQEHVVATCPPDVCENTLAQVMEGLERAVYFDAERIGLASRPFAGDNTQATLIVVVGTTHSEACLLSMLAYRLFDELDRARQANANGNW